MARYRGPKNRIARKFGVNIFGKSRSPLLHKPNPPGMHGAKRKKKSDYGTQLEEKQKLRAVYGMLSQKQLIRAYNDAERKPGNTSHTFLALLESRLDNIVYRLRFGATIFAAQQLVSHGHILVNGKKVDRRSFQVKPGMTISVKKSSQNVKAIQVAVQNTSLDLPEYLDLSDQFTGTLQEVPAYESVSLPLPINVSLVCEFLAHTG
ncbi:MAG: 30S ribosomal protein S4 [Chlamydiota bacterium]